MAKLSLNNVSKNYRAKKGDDVTALRSVSFGIEDGAFATLLGPAGCGKSSVLRVIAGLDEVSSGDVVIGDRRVNDIAPHDRDVAMVFPDYAIFPHLSVRENVAFGLKVRKFPQTEI